MTEWRWLESTRRLQEKSFGVSFPLTGDVLADYVTYNVAALVVELGEFAQEIQWKPWATSRGAVHRERALKELVDCGHFLANLINGLDVTDDEWEAAYRTKQRLNARRQVDGYDGVTGKCPGCRRALDDEPPVEVDDSIFCAACGCRVGAVDD